MGRLSTGWSKSVKSNIADGLKLQVGPMRWPLRNRLRRERRLYSRRHLPRDQHANQLDRHLYYQRPGKVTAGNLAPGAYRIEADAQVR